MKTMKEIDDEARYFTDNRVKCSCGHSLLITSKDGKALCKWCHHYAFVDKNAEIRYRNKEALLRARRELENE